MLVDTIITCQEKVSVLDRFTIQRAHEAIWMTFKQDYSQNLTLEPKGWTDDAS